MHPAFSVLFFTVTSGFGYGFMLCLLAARLSGYIEFGKDDFLLYSGVAAALFTVGLLSSTFHLANPKNAWRSFARFRTSWLSREGVLAVVAYPLIALYLAAIWFEGQGLWISGLLISGLGMTALGVLIMLLIVAILFCTAMIYASLKTIPQWHTRIVPIAFIMFSLSSGLLCLGITSGWQIAGLRNLAVAALIASLLIKLLYFKHLGKPTRSSINTATSFSQAKVTLFDAGHSSKNFLQREFIYEVGPKTLRLARIMSLLLAFIIPAILLALAGSTIISVGAGWIAASGLYLGLLLERWLFFVEAKHVVRHYYAEQ